MSDDEFDLDFVSHAAETVKTKWKDEGTIQVKLQTKDRRAQPVLLDIRPTDNTETVMDKFSSQAGLDKGKLKFFFDGEVLEGAATAEELELESGECIDVHMTE